MEFGVLGPLSVELAGSPVAVHRPKARLVLALLLAHVNTVVTTDTLVESLWGTAPVRSARSNLKTYISTLRTALARDDRAAAPIRTTRNGYLLEVSRESVDALRFEDLLARAAAGRRAGADDTGDLESALGMWRGDPYADVHPACPQLDAVAHRLAELRLTAAQKLVEARLAAGRHTEVIGDLEAWVIRNPLREQLWEQLMTALYRDGRPADALDAYRRLRQRLIQEIGIEPGPSLRQLHRRILNGDPGLLMAAAAPAPPRQLPRDVASLTGRRLELDLLRQQLAAPGSVVVIHGPAGAGKSALALRSAHLAASRYPDGQLYADLLGATPGAVPLTAHECLARLLRALGVARPDVPPEECEAAALFRSMIAGRRMLIVLDNAAAAAQVRPLLPATSGAAVVVTSRDRLAAVSGVTRVAVGPLPAGEAVALLERLAAGRAAAADLTTVTRLCDRLPLAIEIAAARLAGRPDWSPADLARLLADTGGRLAELAAGDVMLRDRLAVSALALCGSHSDTDREAARAFGILSALDIDAIDPFAAAAVLDADAERTERILERLAEIHLLDVDRTGRFHWLDLMRLVARETIGRQTPPAQLRSAVTRGLRYYLATARHATGMVLRGDLSHVGAADPLARPFPDAAAAERWLAVEVRNLLAVAGQALRGDHTQAGLGVGLTVAVHQFIARTRPSSSTDGLIALAASVAERTGDTAALAYLRRCGARPTDRARHSRGYAGLDRNHQLVREPWVNQDQLSP